MQNLIIAQLNQVPGVHVWRSNTGAAKTAQGRLLRFGVVGQADITGIIRGGRRVEIEVKSDRGPSTPGQVKYGEMIVAHGGLYVVARCLDDAMVPVRHALEAA